MLYIFDSTEKLIATLPKGGFFDAVHREVLNGENTFQFTISANSEHSEYVVEGNLVAFRDLDSYWQVFEIKRLVDTHGDGLARTAYCEHIFYELLDDIVTDKRPSADATAALAGMLENTRWQVGIVDDLGAASTSAYYISALEAVQKVAEAWQGELNWRCVINGGVITRYVDLRAMVGTDTGKQFVYSKDILNIEREVDSSSVVTALYGRGKGIELESGSYGRRLTFANVVVADKPAGQEWIGDDDALSRWGRNGRHRFDVFVDEEETDPEVLLQKTRDELARRKIPRVTYRLDVVSLEQLTGYEHEKVRLGDMVRVIDREFNPGLVVSARVIEIERDLFDPANTKVVLGSFAPTIVEATINTARRVDEMANRPFNTKWLDGKISVLQNEIENVQSYVFQTAEDGILVLDAPTYDQATKAMKLGGGMFAIANQKDGNGGWNWRTFGDGSGFTADLITAGIIDAGLVQIGPETTFEPGYDPTQIVAGSTVGMGVDADCLGLWHFDGTLNSHKGVSATFTRASVAYLEDGTQVASGVPRFEDGKFGKGVLIEEGTTNLVSNPDFEVDTAGWNTWGGIIARDTTEHYYGLASLRVELPSGGNPWDGIYSNLITVTAEATYTFSVKLKNQVAGVPMFAGICRADNGAEIGVTAFTSTTGWIAKTVTATIPVGVTSVYVRVSRNNYSGATTFWVDGFQLEQKPHATSFVVGTRDNEVLKVPANVFNKGNWTINLKYKAHQGIDDTWFRVLWECFIDSGNWYQVSFAPSTSAGKLLLRVTCDGNVVVVESDVILSAGTTYDIAATGDGENLKLYVDGVQVGLTTPYAEPVGNLPDYMYVGGQPAHYANGIIDELRIDKIARTDEEIQAWYKANAPFYTSEDMKQWPGYMRLETDGLKVYDSSDALRVLVGSWMNGLLREYGIKIIRGLIEASTISGGSIDIIREVGEAGRVHIENGKISMFAESDNEGEFLCLSLEPFKSWGGTIRFYYFDENTHQTKASARIVGGDGELAIVGDVVILGDFEVTGRKDCVEQTENYGTVVLSARESPEIRYIDEGVGTLINGECRIDVDPIFMECIEPNTEYSRWYIHLTPYADVDIYVAEIGENYFVVKEKKNGTSTGADFTWSLSAIRKNYAGIRLMEVTN